MATLTDLLAEKSRIDADIAAAKPQAIAAIRAQMVALGVTIEDLGGKATRAAPVSKRAVKYRDHGGNTWTGVGQRPRWLRAAVLAGATLEQFRVPA